MPSVIRFLKLLKFSKSFVILVIFLQLSFVILLDNRKLVSKVKFKLKEFDAYKNYNSLATFDVVNANYVNSRIIVGSSNDRRWSTGVIQGAKYI